MSRTPETEIADVDAVVGIGRCVIEAMAMQRAAYVFGNAGVGGWITPDNYGEIEARAFTRTNHVEAIDAARLRDDLRRYDANMGYQNRDLAIAHHSTRRHVAELIELVARLEPAPVADPTPLETVARLVRVQWEVSTRVAIAEGESALLRNENERLWDENGDLTHENSALRSHLERVISGRRYRIAQRLGRPIDAARALIGRPGR